MTAAELIAAQKASGLYYELEAKRAARAAEHRKLELEWQRAAAPLVEDLRSVGWDVSSVWDLVNIDEAYPEALPVLVRHLGRPYPAVVRDGIARALAVRRAVFAWDVIRDQYLKENDRGAKDGLATALGAMVDRQHLDELIALVTDRRNGPSRLLMLRGLRRLRDPRAYSTLEKLVDDPDLYKEIAIILRGRRRRHHT
jgi:hypothetical protein